MANEYICQFGNRDERVKLPILLTDNTRIATQRPRFCGRAHAIAWLMKEMELDRRNRILSASESAKLAVEGIVRLSGEAQNG